MTFDDDFVQLNLGPASGATCVPCSRLGIDWPPPPELILPGAAGRRLLFRQVSRSDITDEQRERMDRICRGAEYELESVLPEGLH